MYTYLFVRHVSFKSPNSHRKDGKHERNRKTYGAGFSQILSPVRAQTPSFASTFVGCCGQDAPNHGKNVKHTLEVQPCLGIWGPFYLSILGQPISTSLISASDFFESERCENGGRTNPCAVNRTSENKTCNTVSNKYFTVAWSNKSL